MKLVLASHNAHKVKEIREMLPSGWELFSLADLDFHQEIEETASTLQGNAQLKAETISQTLQLPVIADDTGLEIDALHGEPGVFSARYAGEEKDAKKNMALVLHNLKGERNRKAQFRTVIAYARPTMNTLFFEGTVKGSILEESMGEKGFGYDPIFQPLESDKSFAQMSAEEKNAISHRAKALSALLQFFEDEVNKE